MKTFKNEPDSLKVTFRELSDLYSRRLLDVAGGMTVHVAGLIGKDLARAHFRLALGLVEIPNDALITVSCGERTERILRASMN